MLLQSRHVQRQRNIRQPGLGEGGGGQIEFKPGILEKSKNLDKSKNSKNSILCARTVHDSSLIITIFSPTAKTINLVQVSQGKLKY